MSSERVDTALKALLESYRAEHLAEIDSADVVSVVYALYRERIRSFVTRYVGHLNAHELGQLFAELTKEVLVDPEDPTTDKVVKLRKKVMREGKR